MIHKRRPIANQFLPILTNARGQTKWLKPDGLLVFDVWESAEDWQRFAEGRLGAAIAAATGGQGPQPEPRFFPLIREERR